MSLAVWKIHGEYPNFPDAPSGSETVTNQLCRTWGDIRCSARRPLEVEARRDSSRQIQ